jgi:hypothetical protein
MEAWQIGIGLVICFVLMFQRRFWFVLLTMCSLSAGLELLSCIVHYQIPGALGYFILMISCWSFAGAIAESYPVPKENRAKEVHLSEPPDWSPY